MALAPVTDEEQSRILQLTVAAIGGPEEDENGVPHYSKGDECLECLGDLIRAIKREDDGSCSVIHQLGVWEVLQEHLIPIVHAYQTDEVLVRAAIRLMVYLTKPTAPWKEDRARQLSYMQAQKLHLLEGPTLELFVGMLVNAIAIPAAERPPAALEIMANLLQLMRNLALVPDTPVENVKKLDGGRIETAGLQDLLVERFKEHGVIDVVLTLASAIDDEKASKLQVDHLVLEIIYLLFLRTTPDDVANASTDSARTAAKASQDLKMAVLKEQAKQRMMAHRPAHRNARHSRFGGSYVRQSETGQTAVVIKAVTVVRDGRLDDAKRPRTKIVLKKNAMENMYVTDSQLNARAIGALQDIADEFIVSGYHPLMHHLVKRFTGTVGIHEKDITLYLWMTSYFLRYFNLRRQQQVHRAHEAGSAETGTVWSFGYVGTSLELDTLRFVIQKVRLEYIVPETKNWSSAHVGIRCLREALLVIEGMAKDTTEATRDVADHVLHNLFYENQLLELTLELWREYTQQSRAYAVSLVELTDILIRLLESYTKQKPLFVQSKRRRSRKRKTAGAGATAGLGGHVAMRPDGTEVKPSGDRDDEEEDEEGHDEDQMAEKKFEFEAFVTRFASDHIITAYVELLETMEDNGAAVNRMIVRLLHRFFVTLNLQGFFYKLRLFDVFNRVLQQPNTDKVHGEVRQLILYITKCFFKRLQEYPVLHLELLFPKTFKDSQFIQFGEQAKAAKHKNGPAADGTAGDGRAADSNAAGGRAKDDAGPKLLPVLPGAFDDVSDDEDGDVVRPNRAPAASVEVRLQLPRERMIHALILHLQERSRSDDLAWLRQCLDDAALQTSDGLASTWADGDQPVEAESATTTAPAVALTTLESLSREWFREGPDLVASEEVHWAALNDAYFRLLLATLGFESPTAERTTWRLPAASRTARKELAELVGELMYAAAPTDPPLPPWDELFYDRAAELERARERVRQLKKKRRSRKRALEQGSGSGDDAGAQRPPPKARRSRKQRAPAGSDSDGAKARGGDSDASDGASGDEEEAPAKPSRKRRSKGADGDNDGDDSRHKKARRGGRREEATPDDAGEDPASDDEPPTSSQRSQRRGAKPQKLQPRQMPDEIASSDLDEDGDLAPAMDPMPADPSVGGDDLATSAANKLAPEEEEDASDSGDSDRESAAEDDAGAKATTTEHERGRAADADSGDSDDDAMDGGLTIAPMAGDEGAGARLRRRVVSSDTE